MVQAVTKTELREWFQRGVEQSATHMVVVCDTYDHEDYPVYVRAGENVHAVAKLYDDKNMQRIMEVYSLRRDMELQMNEHRAFHYD